MQEAMLCGASCLGATFLITAAAAFSQKPGLPPSTSEVSQKGEQQILQLEAETLKGEMNSDPAVVEKIYADDCVNPSGPGWTKAKLERRFTSIRVRLLPASQARKMCTFTCWVTPQ
jgi:hypothetical protein